MTPTPIDQPSLAKLIEAVSGRERVLVDDGRAVQDGIDWPALIWAAIPAQQFPDAWLHCLKALRGSVDAAIEFCETMLPGWMRVHSQRPNGWRVVLTSPDFEFDCWVAGGKAKTEITSGAQAVAEHSCEPIALVLAVLRAKLVEVSQ